MSPTEGSYKDGIETSKSYYDNNGKMVKKEEFYTDQQQRKDGVETSRFHYDSNGTILKKEDFYTDQKQREAGVANIINYYDSNGKIVKKEEFYSDQKQRKDGIETSRFYYDSSGKMVRKEDFHADQRQQDVNDFRCLKSIGVKTPIRLQFVFTAEDKPDVGYVIYKNGSGPIAVKKLKEREVREIPGGRPSVFEAQWEEITSDGTGGKYIIFSQGARIYEFRYIRKKDGKLFKFEEDVEAWTEKGCEWNKK